VPSGFPPPDNLDIKPLLKVGIETATAPCVPIFAIDVEATAEFVVQTPRERVISH